MKKVKRSAVGGRGRPVGYSYIRWSTKPQGRGDSKRRQTEDTVAGESPATWCARHDVTFDTAMTYADVGSAFTGENARSGALALFLEAIDRGRVRPGDFLLVEKVDRLTRQGIDEGKDLVKKILKAGVNIVLLGQGGRVWDADMLKTLGGSIEIDACLDQAWQFSRNLSDRVGAAWEGKRERARSKKRTLVTTNLPGWLRIVGAGESRRILLIPEKVAVMGRIFALALAGQGVGKIQARLLKEGVPPISASGKWTRWYVHALLTDPAVIGTYQPKKRVGKRRVPDGAPVENYYPAAIEVKLFRQAALVLGKRRTAERSPRDGKWFNLFAGLIRDARTGLPYRQTERTNPGLQRQYMLKVATASHKDSYSFPYPVLENAFLDCLREIKSADILPATPGGGVLLNQLRDEADWVDAEIAKVTADLQRGWSDTLGALVRRHETRRRELDEQMREEERHNATPLADAWDEAGTILQTIDGAKDRAAVLRRLRVVLRRQVEGMRLLVTSRKMDRIAALQVFFQGGAARSWIIYHRPARGNGRQPPKIARTWRESFADAFGRDDFDLRNPADVAELTRVLATITDEDLAALSSESPSRPD